MDLEEFILQTRKLVVAGRRIDWVVRKLRDKYGLEEMREAFAILTPFLDEKRKTIAKSLRYDSTPLDAEIIFCIMYKIKEIPKCVICGDEVNFMDLTKGYRKVCSRSCGQKNKSKNKYSELEDKIKEIKELVEATKKSIGKEDLVNEIKSIRKENPEIRAQIILRDLQEKYENSNIRQMINELTPFLDHKEEKFKLNMHHRTVVDTEMLYCIVNDITECRKCSTCLVNDVEFQDFFRGYGETCSVECQKKSSIIKAKIEATTLKHFGVKNPFNSKVVRSKIKKTLLEKYGVDNPLKSPEIRQRISKTWMEKYGVDQIWKSNDFIEKRRLNWLEKYGVDNPSMLPSVQAKISKSLNKIQGQIQESLEKVKFKRKELILPSGNSLWLQGYEHFAVLDLLDEGFSENEFVSSTKEINKILGVITYTGEDLKTHRYYPDFYIPKLNKIIEVKSPYTFQVDAYDNFLIMCACLSKGLDFEFWIYGNK